MGIGDFLIYLNIIRKRLWLIILLLIVTVSGIVFISTTADPVYRASVRLQVVASEPQEVALFSSFSAGASATELATADRLHSRPAKRYRGLADHCRAESWHRCL